MKKHALFLGIVSLFLVGSLTFSYKWSWELGLKDLIYQRNYPVDSRIVLIGIDEETVNYCGRWPFNRQFYTELIENLLSGQPTAVFLDVLLSESTAEDVLLAKTIKKEQIILAGYGVLKSFAESNRIAVESFVYPTDVLMENATIAHINVIPDNDGFIRKGLTELEADTEKIQSAPLKIIEFLNLQDVYRPFPTDASGQFYIHYAGGPDTFTYLSFSQVLKNEIPMAFFEDKIVFIGPYMVGIGDRYFTAVDHQAPMYGIEIHANIVNQYLNQKFLYEPSFFMMLLMSIVIVTLLLRICLRLSPLKAFGCLVGGLSIYALILFLTTKWGFMLPILPVVLSCVMVYIYTVVFRYLVAVLEKKRIKDMFSKYVAPQVVEEVIKQSAHLKLGGERKNIAVLFVDIRGFTPLSEQAEPEEVVEILNKYLTLCATSIFKCGGTLDKFIGDAAMAIFNAPLHQEDYVFKAVEAALFMKQGAQELKEEIWDKYQRAVEFGIGIHMGDAVIGNIGATFRMDYTAIGDTVNTAARLESVAKAGQILISEQVYECIKTKVEANYLGLYKVKGKESEIPVYQVENSK